MKFTKTLLAVALAAASTGAMAAPVAWTGAFVMYNPVGGLMDANDGAAGTSAFVTGAIDTGAGTFSLASTDTFFGLNWSTAGGTLYGAGTHTVSTLDPGCGATVACGGNYTFTVGAGQLGGVIDFAWGATSGIDVVMVWNVATAGGMTTYTSSDWDGNGTPGAGMIDGPFPGFSANFNMSHVAAAPIPEASTYGMMLAGLGLVGFAVRRRKLVA